MKSQGTTPIRELMPEGYIPKLVEYTGAARSTISNVVKDERYTSKIWPFVKMLAVQTNPEAYAERMAFLEWRKKQFEQSI